MPKIIHNTEAWTPEQRLAWWQTVEEQDLSTDIDGEAVKVTSADFLAYFTRLNQLMGGYEADT